MADVKVVFYGMQEALRGNETSMDLEGDNQSMLQAL